MIEQVIALLMIVNHEIKEHRIQDTMSECLKGKRVAERQLKIHEDTLRLLSISRNFLANQLREKLKNIE